MRAAVIIVLALFLGAPLYAQENLIGGDVELGGFGGPSVQFTSINGEFGLLAGGWGGMIIDHTVAIGGAGYGLVNDVSEANAPAATPYLNFGYGGGFVQYINGSDNLIHFTGRILIGGGGLGFRSSNDNDEHSSGDRDTLNDVFFVAEPSVEAELNVIKWMRLCVGGGYRFISGIEIAGITNGDISGPHGQVMVKFGSF